MIRVRQAARPDTFDDLVANPGQMVLRELASDPRAPKRLGPKRKKLAPLWTRMLPEMRKLYRRVCAYTALYIHRGTGRDTVDHYLDKDTHPDRAYDWDNYRYACIDVNRLKGTTSVLDPFEVCDDWFGLNLVSFEVELRVPSGPDTTKWAKTLKILNDPSFCDARKWYHERYFGRKLDDFDPADPMPYETLLRESPFVARELRRQNRLNPGDAS